MRRCVQISNTCCWCSVAIWCGSCIIGSSVLLKSCRHVSLHGISARFICTKLQKSQIVKWQFVYFVSLCNNGLNWINRDETFRAREHVTTVIKRLLLLLKIRNRHCLCYHVILNWLTDCMLLLCSLDRPKSDVASSFKNHTNSLWPKVSLIAIYLQPPLIF